MNYIKMSLKKFFENPYHRGKQLLVSVFLYFFSIFVMAACSVLMVYSNIGASAYDTLNFALSAKLGIKTSSAIYLTSIIALIIASLIRRKPPRLSTFLTSFIIGLFVDFWKGTLNFMTPQNMIESIIQFSIGTILLAFSIAIYMLSSFPTNPLDDLMVALKEKSKPIGLSKIAIDGSCLILSIFLTGRIVWGALLVTIIIGPMIDIAYRIMNIFIRRDEEYEKKSKNIIEE